MKSYIYLLLLFLTPYVGNAQFAQIIDKEGYVNLRESPNLKSKIIGKIKSTEIIFLSNKGIDNKGWSYVDYEQKTGNIFSKYVSGYIHNSRLKQINAFPLIPSVEESEKESNFSCCGVEVNIKSAAFDFQKNKQYFQKFEGYYTYKGKYALGAGGIFPPKTHYLSIDGLIKQTHFEIPQSELANLFHVNNDMSECYYDSEGNNLYLILNNSDGADAYNALLIIENGKYKRLIINSDN